MVRNLNTLPNSELYCFIKQRLAKEFVEMLVANNLQNKFNERLIANLTEIRNYCKTTNFVALHAALNPIVFVYNDDDAKSAFKNLSVAYVAYRNSHIVNFIEWQTTQQIIFRKILNNIPYKTIHWLIENKVFTKFCNAVRAQLPERVHIQDVSWLYIIAMQSPFGLIDFDQTEETHAFWYNLYKKHYRYLINN